MDTARPSSNRDRVGQELGEARLGGARLDRRLPEAARPPPTPEDSTGTNGAASTASPVPPAPDCTSSGSRTASARANG